MSVTSEGLPSLTDVTIVFSHGFTVAGFESRRMFVDLAERLLAHGFASIIFDYRGSGYSDLNFEEMRLDTELEDLFAVLQFARTKGAHRIAVWGMSLGTLVAARAANLEPSSVDGLVLWCSSVDTYRRWQQRYGAGLKVGGGEMYIPAGYKVTTPLIESVKDFDLVENLRSTTCPLLMVHGTEDDASDIELATHAMDDISRSRDLDRIIVYGGNHGFKNQPDIFERTVRDTLNWISGFSRR